MHVIVRIQNAAALIDIAHPDHRDHLGRETREAGLIPRVHH